MIYINIVVVVRVGKGVRVVWRKLIRELRLRSSPDTNGMKRAAVRGVSSISQCAACCCGVFALCSDSLVSLVGLGRNFRRK